MAQKRRSGRFVLSAKVQRWAGLCLVALGVFCLAALVTFDPGAYRDAHERGEAYFPFAGRLVEATAGGPFIRGPVSVLYHNAAGGLGVLAASGLVSLLGWVVVWLVPAALLAWGWNRLLLRPHQALLWKSLAAVPLGITLAGVTAAFLDHPYWGGAIGGGLWRTVHAGVGPVGGTLLLATAGIGFLFLEAEAWDGRRGAFTRAVFRVLARAAALAGQGLVYAGRKIRSGLILLVGWIRSRPWEGGVSVDRAEADFEETVRSDPKVVPRDEDEEEEWVPRIVNHEAEAPAPPTVPPRPVPTPAAAAAPGNGFRDAAPSGPPPAPLSDAGLAAALADPEGPGPVVRRSGADQPLHDVEDAVMEARALATPGKVLSPPRRKRGTLVVPPLDILDDVPETGPPVDEEELHENSRILTQTLSEFGVTGRVGEVHPGPVITRYEYVPGPGVKVSQILNRQDDLALKLRASRIRILAPIPGKAAVGIEVPNRKPSPIFLRRLLETQAFRNAGGPLPLVLGKDINGGPVTTELSKMPHLLIAGTTGSGKSVCMNALISSLLMKRTPDELRMLMIDPKMLELPMYNGIPHLLTEVVTDPKVAVRAFKWALLEMERRYRVLSVRGCRNLASYNAKMDSEGPLKEGEEKLPYIVILVDELADLMITSGREVEEPIARLAQLARAVGIHLIVATQRPSVDVITGVIKANFPCRIAFQVASKIDSRTILDQNGAESLLGKGDMLFLPPGQAAPNRVHGAFVSEEETQRLAQAWRDQAEPEAHASLEEVLAEPEASAAGGLGDDALFEDAARLVVQAGQASASLLQRRLKVGYARAARLVDMLEAAGVVAPQDGSKPRDILVDEVRLEHVLAGMDG